MRTVLILSISSDIGMDLANRYLSNGWKVVGTYRHNAKLAELGRHKNCSLIACDISKENDIIGFAKTLRRNKIVWDVLISCVGYPLPVMPFFETNFKEWSDSVHVNCLGQLHALHSVYPMRRKKNADVVLFAGGGMNGPVKNFSAYTASKIFLTKMCEFLDAENPDLNIFIVGPGWTRTKIHQTILADKRTYKEKIKETKEFLKEKQGTPLKDIFDSIEWLRSLGKNVVSGRNFSIVHDPWRANQRQALVKALKQDAQMYKLRRSGNSFLK